MLEILIIIALYTIYKLVREIVNQRKCPSESLLRGVLLGRIKKNTDKADFVIMHLGICEKCQQRAKEIGSE